ncbi:manganese superoxide dismutase [Trametes meyenii]|nr:manganese superoxide dismutase [Trametes meyenii]
MSVLTAIARSSARAARPVSRAASLSLAASAARGLHTLPKLDYAYDALEPHISGQIMELHHSKHHQAYVNGLNAAEESYARAPSPKDQIRLQPALKFNGGGHINHSLFWKNLAPESQGGGKLEAGPLKDAIVADFGSVDAFKKKVNAATAAIQGSGWGWVGYNTETKKLEVVTTANQDPLLTHVPIVGIDIWEHAFYLQYHNVKADYLTAIWNVINFKEAERRFVEASKQ